MTIYSNTNPTELSSKLSIIPMIIDLVIFLVILDVKDSGSKVSDLLAFSKEFDSKTLN
jgi:hypothetical protein